MTDPKYLIPESQEEALSMKAKGGLKASFLAGGTYVNWDPVRNESEIVIDLRNILENEVVREGKTISIGAGLTLQGMADNTGLPEGLRKGAGSGFSRQIRNMATLGGDIGASHGNSLLLPVLITMEARLKLGSGESVLLEEWLTGARNDLITRIILPYPEKIVETEMVSRSSAAYPVLCAAVSLKPGPVISVCGAVGKLQRLFTLEEALSSNPDLSGSEIEELVRNEIDPVSDIHGGREYKKYITAVTAADLVDRCRVKES